MEELYWLNVVDSLSTVFVILTICSCIWVLLSFVHFYNTYVEEKKLYDDEDRKNAKRIFLTAVSVSIAMFFANVFIPTKHEFCAIYGIGSVIDYCKQSDNAKKLPENAVKALNEYLESVNEKDN